MRDEMKKKQKSATALMAMLMLTYARMAATGSA
jgi:hypothetical protein